MAAEGSYGSLNALTVGFALAAVLCLLAVGSLDEYRARAGTEADRQRGPFAHRAGKPKT